MVYLDETFSREWAGQDVFSAADRLRGEVSRRVTGRKTMAFRLAGNDYYIKRHYGVGWLEILKNLLFLRPPILGARNEVQAIRRLEQFNLDTMTLAAYAERGVNPARRQSFIITRALTNTVSLETFCADWATQPPRHGLKRALIEKVADISRRLHGCGVNHRDFYLCHFLLDLATLDNAADLRLYLIDLHRAQIRETVPDRWRLKDIAGLLYSALGAGLTRRDLLRFMTIYSGKTLRQTLAEDHDFWAQVARKAAAMYLDDHPALPANLLGWLC